jgi:hypothetical protein
VVVLFYFAIALVNEVLSYFNLWLDSAKVLFQFTFNCLDLDHFADIR